MTSTVDSIATVLRRLDPEVWIITARDEARAGGLVSTTLISASIVPDMPRVALTVARQHATWNLIERSRSFVAHLIDANQLDWVWRFGLHSGRDVSKLDGLSHRTGTLGVPILNESLAWLECRVEARLDIGDRTLDVAEVVDGGMHRDGAPLTMQRLMDLAPTERRQQLKANLERDARIDAAAIQKWRNGN